MFRFSQNRRQALLRYRFLLKNVKMHCGIPNAHTLGITVCKMPVTHTSLYICVCVKHFRMANIKKKNQLLFPH